MSCNNQSNGNLIIALNSLVAIVISDDLDADQLNVLGNFIVAVGSLILTKAAQIQLEQSTKQDGLNNEVKQQMQSIIEKLINQK